MSHGAGLIWSKQDRPLNRSLRALVSIMMLAGCLAAVTPAARVSATDSATDSATIDGLFAGTGRIGPGLTRNLTVTGRGGVPDSGVGAVALNVTATGPSLGGYLTVWPTGAARPSASNLNFTAGQTIPNMVVVPVGDGGQISIFNFSGSVDVVVDVLGWFPVRGSFTGLTPARLMETRPQLHTIDGLFNGTGAIGQGLSRDLTVLGRGGVPTSGVGAVALNVTATGSTLGGYLTVWPTGDGRPTASNLNFTPGQSIPNMVIVPVGAGGKISIFNFAGSVDVVVDVLGWFPVGSSFTGLTPARLMETRPQLNTIDGLFNGTGPIGQGLTRNLTVLGRGGVPGNGVGAVALNVTATGPTLGGYLTVWPTGQGKPKASNLNFTPGQSIPNMVIVPVGSGGQISIFNAAGFTDVVVDVLGWFPTTESFTGLTPARLVDTRGMLTQPPADIGTIRNLLVLRPELHQMAGTDAVAVWVCDVPTPSTPYAGDGPTRLSLDPDAIAAWAQLNAAPYFDTESSARYHAVFSGMGHIALTSSDGPDSCRQKAEALTVAPFTNVLAVDNTTRQGGRAGPGTISQFDGSNLNVFAVSPSETLRGMWVGGGSIAPDQFPAANVLVHEMGHALHWPHNFIGPASEYDDPVDVMSGSPANGRCSKPIVGGGTWTWPCVPQNTMAFNRFAAGWISDGQVQLQLTGSQKDFTLDAPMGAGLQMVVAPDTTNPKVMLTLEARPRTGADQYQTTEGVAAYIVDQRPTECGSLGSFFSSCISSFRRQYQAIGSPNGTAHVLQLGTTTVIGGVSISVTAHVGDSFTVSISGTFTAP